MEEGEGRGPLLEYFGLVGAQLADESSCANKTSTTAKGTGCEHSGITNYQTISMLGYHQGSEALWFAESDAAAQALELQMMGQGCKASEATDQLSETTSIMPLNADEDEAKGQIDVGADALSQLSEDWRDEDPTSLGAVAILAERWCAAGVLLGAALTSRCGNALSLSLSSVLLRLLLVPVSEWSSPASSSLVQHLCHNSVVEAMILLQSFDPSIASMARLVLNEDGQGLSDEDYSSMLELESLHDISPCMTREQYVQRMVQTVVLEPVKVQLNALRAGWRSALPQRWLAQLAITPTELHVMLGGASEGVAARTNGTPSDFNWRNRFQVVEDPELLDGSPTLRTAFWATMENGLSPTEKREVLAFITGVSRPPAARSGELLRVEMPFTFFGDEEKKSAWGTLPQAHTCSNTLELPNYCEAWQWHNQYNLQRRQGLSSQGSAPGETANLARGVNKEGTVDNDEPAVAELSAVIKERLLTAARGSQGYTLDAL